MEALLKELQEFKGMLDANVTCDWNENNPEAEFSALSEQLQQLIEKHTPSERDRMCERLANYICDDEDEYANMDEALALLEKQSEIDGSVMADDIVMMWAPLEFRYTVDQLLDEL